MRRALPVLAALSMWPAQALADATTDIADATKLLRQVREEQAIQVLSRALDRGDATVAQRGQIYVLLGVARYGLRDEEGARLAFRRAFETNPIIAFPRFGHPKALKLFDAARAAHAAEAMRPAPREEPEPPDLSVPPPPPQADAPMPPVVQPAPAAQAEAVRPAPSRRLSIRTLPGIGVAMAGAGVGVAGAWLMLDAQTLRRQAVDDPDAMAAQDLYGWAVSQDSTGFILAIVGSGVAVAGISLALWPSSSTPLSVAVTPRGIAVAGRF